MKDLRERSPRVHCITNYVTARDVANMVLAAGGSLVMAQELHGVGDVTSICSSLVLNLGTLEEKAIPTMEAAGRKAAVLGLPVTLSPVGITASRFRGQTAIDMIRKAAPSIIWGNEAEVQALNQELGGHEVGNTRGVDSGTLGTIESHPETACSLGDLIGAVTVMAGEEDMAAGKERRFIVGSSHPWMARITGSGCMLDGLMGAFCSLYRELGPDGPLEEAVVMALSTCRLCGELAAGETAGGGGRIGTFRVYLMDKMSLLDDGAPEKDKGIEV